MNQLVLGSLKDLFDNKDVHEICVNHFDNIYYQDKSDLKLVKDIFKNQEELEGVISGLFKSVNRQQNHSKIQHLTLSCGTRVAVIGKELNKGSTAFNLMKPVQQEFGWDDLKKWDAIREEGIDTIKNMISENANILIAGSGRSGIITIANNILKLVPKELRTISIERVNEFNINRPHHLSLTSHENEITNLKDLSEGTRYLRADYLFYGQTHGPELPALFERISENTSAIALTNAESPIEALQKLELQMLAQETVFDIELIRGLISRSFDYIVFTNRDGSGKRQVENMVQLEGYELGKYLTKEIYRA